MATITKTFKETEGDKSTWTLALSLNDVTITDSNIDLLPTLLGKYSAISGKNGAALMVDYSFSVNGQIIGTLRYGEAGTVVSLAGNTNRNWSKTSGDLKAYISAFNSGNPTDIKVPITVKSTAVVLDSGHRLSGGGMESPIGSYNSHTDLDWGTLAYIKLDAPPTFTSSNVSFDTSYVYTGLTTASVNISELSAKYGGTISEVKLAIGNQSVTRSDNGTLSILLEAEGTFTPTVTVTDSRGQTTTKTLEAITVNGYTAPSAVFSAERTTATGVDDDEGEYAVLDTNITFTDVVADLTAPTVTIDGTPATVTWYSSRATDGTLSGTVNWSALTSPATVYGLISVPNIQTSYSVSLTPNDTKGSGTPITQTIASAFYTIDFLAGGHGIAFGQPSSEDGFFVNMDAHFKDKANLVRALFDFIHPVGSYYETSDTTFDPNATWGGTWVLETEGQVHISAGANYAVNGALTNATDGGEKTHKLTANELPHITGSIELRPWRTGTTNGAMQLNPTGVFGRESGTTQTGVQTSGASASAYKTTISFGNDQSHNNMQPYIVVNRWHRTA